MKSANSKLYNAANSKIEIFTKICFLLLLFTLSFNNYAYAHDADYGVWHGEQNALILGTIENIEGPECSISVTEALPCPKGADFYRMLPLNDIPSNMIVDMNDKSTYYISYNKRKKFQIGDYVILAVDKANKNWRLTYPPCEVSSLDSNTLEFLPKGDKRTISAAWEEFIHTKGKVHNFAFHGPDLLANDPDSKEEKTSKKIFSENSEDETITNINTPETSKIKSFSGWIKDSSSIFDYSWAVPIIILVIITLRVLKKSNSK